MSEIKYMDSYSRNGVLTAFGAKIKMKNIYAIHAIQHDHDR